MRLFSIIARWWSDLPLARKGIVVVLLPLVALLCGFAALYALSRAESTSQRWIVRTLKARNDISATMTSVWAAENAVRGFAVTKHQEFAEQYTAARNDAKTSLSRLAALIRENPNQIRRLSELRDLMNDRYDLLETVVGKARGGLSPSDREMTALVLGGKSMLEKIRAKLAEMDSEEVQVQTQRLAELDQVRDLSVATGAATVTMGLVGGLGAALLFSNSIVRRVRLIGANAECLAAERTLNTRPAGDDEISAVERQLHATSELLAGKTKALRESEARLQAIMDHTTAVVFVKDLKGRFLLVNRHFENLFHMSRSKVRGKTALELFPQEFAEVFRANDQKVLQAGRPLQFEERVPHDDGIHTYLSLKFPLLNSEGAPYALCGVSTDISERKQQEQGLQDAKEELERRVRERTAELEETNERLRAEITERQATAEALAKTQEQFLEAQKMEALGQLAGGVAHDFNNILTAIMGYGTLLLDEIPEAERDDSHVAEILRSSERAAALSKQLLAFSRRQPTKPEVLDLGVLIDDVRKMLRQVIGDRVSLRTDIDDALSRIKADAGHIEQVLLNLAINARDAMPRGGTITIGARNVSLPPEAVQVDSGVRDFVALSVRDDGTGITPEVLERIFDPFFTTKRPGQGTGLGLATCSAIAEKSGGWMICKSEVGVGTEFVLYLPVVDEALEQVARPKYDNEVPRGSETLLVVEDEPAVGELLCLMLTNLGYDVIRAEDGEQAEEAVAQRAGQIDLVLTDLNMPRMDGRELVLRLSAQNPDLKVIVTSGNEVCEFEGEPEIEFDFLPKPFTMQTLARTIREVLDADRPLVVQRATVPPFARSAA